MKNIRVTHLSFSSGGGAGQIAKRLSEFRSESELIQDLVVLTEGDITAIKKTQVRLISSALFDFFVVKKARNPQLFTLYRKGKSAVAKKLLKNPPEVLHLHWYPGVISLDEIQEVLDSSTSLVVTLHDMYPLTGGCHFSEACIGYRSNCKNCPQVRRIFRRRVESELQKKFQLFSSNHSIVVTSPAMWLCDEARESKVFKSSRIIHVPNPLDLDLFKPITREKRLELRKNLGIRSDSMVLGFCASNLVDPRKNLEGLLSYFQTSRKVLGDKIQLVVIGDRLPSEDKSAEGLIYLGKIDDLNELIEAYSVMDVFCSLSTDETFPNTIHECAALGIPSILSNIPGHRHCEGKFGILVSDSNSFQEAVSSLLNGSFLREQMSIAALQYVQELRIEHISKQYFEIYKSLAK